MKQINAKQTPVSKPDFIRAVGRRKTAVARVRLSEGEGESLINGQPIEGFFPGENSESPFWMPFRCANVFGKYYATVKVMGGGKVAQAQAMMHGIARALIKKDPDLRPELKKKGLLTRDSRMKERRKAGFAHAARARKQSPKR